MAMLVISVRARQPIVFAMGGPLNLTIDTFMSVSFLFQ